MKKLFHQIANKLSNHEEQFFFFEKLPTDIQIEIFKRVPQLEARKLCGICRKWNALMHQPNLYPHLVGCDLVEKIVKHLLQPISFEWILNEDEPYSLPKVKIYELKTWKKADRIFFSISKDFLLLNKIDLENKSFGQLCIELKLKVYEGLTFTFIKGYPKNLVLIFGDKAREMPYPLYIKPFQESINIVNQTLQLSNPDTLKIGYS